MLFSYFNPILQMGTREIRRCGRRSGADGVLATDLTPEEAVDYRAAMQSRGLDTIFLGGAHFDRRASRENR